MDWFSQFDLVFNALDNLDARRHVNRMCLAANVALIESGTTGFNGQVQVIKKVGNALRWCISIAILENTQLTYDRDKRNATTATKNRYRNHSRSAL